MKTRSANGQAFIDALKSFFRGLFKICAILLSWICKMIGVIGEKLGEMFEKLGTK